MTKTQLKAIRNLIRLSVVNPGYHQPIGLSHLLVLDQIAKEPGIDIDGLARALREDVGSLENRLRVLEVRMRVVKVRLAPDPQPATQYLRRRFYLTRRGERLWEAL